MSSRPRLTVTRSADQRWTRPRIVGLMPRSQPGAGEIARDIRHLLALVGLPECVQGNQAGGFHISAYGDRVKVSWSTESGFYDQAGTIGLSHPQHPMTRLDRTVISVMERALADVLYAAGFTVILQPGIPNAGPEKERDPEVIVAAGPDFKAWAVLYRARKSARRSPPATAMDFKFRSPTADSGDAGSYRRWHAKRGDGHVVHRAAAVHRRPGVPRAVWHSRRVKHASASYTVQSMTGLGHRDGLDTRGPVCMHRLAPGSLKTTPVSRLMASKRLFPSADW